MTEGKRMPLKWVGLGLLGAALLAGCNAADEYLVWPETARTGDTVAVLFNTELDVTLAPDGALLDAGVHNVVVQVSDSTGFTQAVTPRFVIEAPAALGSAVGVTQGLESLTGVVAVFDLPDPWPNAGVAFPDPFSVLVEHAGVPVPSGSSALTVLGGGGAPTVFSSSADPSGFELQPMLRLRPAWDSATGEGFDPSWVIGGLEFTLRYTPGAGDVSNLRATGNGEAAAGLAMATELSPQGSDKRWHIVLMHPPGFQLPELGCTAGGDCFSGRWALLDLPLDMDPTGVPQGAPVFAPADFTIEDLKIYDPDGIELASAAPGETFFHPYAASNVSPLPEPSALLGIAAGCLSLGALRRLERRRPRAKRQRGAA